MHAHLVAQTPAVPVVLHSLPQAQPMCGVDASVAVYCHLEKHPASINSRLPRRCTCTTNRSSVCCRGVCLPLALSENSKRLALFALLLSLEVCLALAAIVCCKETCCCVFCTETCTVPAQSCWEL